MFSVIEDVNKGPEHPLSKTLREEWCPALLAITPQIMEDTPRKPMLLDKIMLAFHFMRFDWHDMVTKVPVPSALGITNAPPPDFYSILQNLCFGVFTLLPEYPFEVLLDDGDGRGRGSRGRRRLRIDRGGDSGEAPLQETKIDDRK